MVTDCQLSREVFGVSRDWLAPFRPSYVRMSSPTAPPPEDTLLCLLASVEAADFTEFLFGWEDRLVENVEGLMFKRRKEG